MLLWRVRELVSSPARVARFWGASHRLRSDAGILVSNVCGGVWLDRSLVHHVDDLAAEIRGGDPMVWRSYVLRRGYFVGPRITIIASSLPILWRHGGMFRHRCRNFVSLPVCKIGTSGPYSFS